MQKNYSIVQQKFKMEVEVKKKNTDKNPVRLGTMTLINVHYFNFFMKYVVKVILYFGEY